MDDLFTTKQELIKTTNDNTDFVGMIKRGFVKTINNVIEYSRNFEKRLMRCEENLRNTREELESIRNEHNKRSGEEVLNNLEDQLVIARNYLRVIKEDESKD